MTKPEPSAALLISVWSQDGTRIGRIRGFRNTREAQGEPHVVAGDQAIIDAVREWLGSLDRSDPTG